MSLEVTGLEGPNNGSTGHEDSMEIFVNDHIATDRKMQNFMKGVRLNTPIPPYDPKHPDNQWPVMIFHPVRQPEIIGVSLVGLKDDKATGEKKRSEAIEDNEAALKSALARPGGWRREPYLKPDVRVLSPEEEKSQLLSKLDEKDAKLNALADAVQKLTADAAARDAAPPSKGAK